MSHPSEELGQLIILYYRIAGKFGGELNFHGGLAVCVTTAKLKSAKISYLHNIHMAIPYQTTKFKSANILVIVILGSTAKFNSHQYFDPVIQYAPDIEFSVPYIHV